MKTLKERVRSKIDALNDEAFRLQQFEAWLKEDIDMEKGSPSAYTGGHVIDIDNPSRKDTESLLRALKLGKWVKEKQGTKINYISEKPIFGNVKLRLWCADPPGTCRMVEEEVVIPAQPERVEKRMVLKCEPMEVE